jgi:hypothetical protein
MIDFEQWNKEFLLSEMKYRHQLLIRINELLQMQKQDVLKRPLTIGEITERLGELYVALENTESLINQYS